jgi:hypothetical protein
MEMSDLWGDCRPGHSAESAIDESGSTDKFPKGEEVKIDMAKAFDLKKYNLVFWPSYKGGTLYE